MALSAVEQLAIQVAHQAEAQANHLRRCRQYFLQRLLDVAMLNSAQNSAGQPQVNAPMPATDDPDIFG